MRVSTRTRYAARALAALAAAPEEGPVSVRKLAESERISPKYLEHILFMLSAAGLVRAVRGKRGGYELARPAESITLRDLFEVMEGSVAPVECVDEPQRCTMVQACPTHGTWVELKEAVVQVLERTTVRDLAERKLATVCPSSFSV